MSKLIKTTIIISILLLTYINICSAANSTNEQLQTNLSKI